METDITFRLNGEMRTVRTEPLRRLLDVLRDECGLTGTKEGCGEGECGACAVLLDGALANACLMPAALAAGRAVTTIEGFRGTKRFEVIARCFEEEGAVQCGFCTPGMVLAAEALLSANPRPTGDDVRTALEGNLCRCTGYRAIVDAVLRAAREGAGLW